LVITPVSRTSANGLIQTRVHLVCVSVFWIIGIMTSRIYKTRFELGTSDSEYQEITVLQLKAYQKSQLFWGWLSEMEEVR
jgi:hypothetical protein